MNSSNLIGNLTREPELRYIEGGTAVCELSVAVNETWKTKDGEKKEYVSFIDVKVWGKQGENCAEYLSKGRAVGITGKLRQDRWEDKDTGKGRSKLYIVASNVKFLGGPKDTTSKGVDKNGDDIPF